MRRYHEIKGRRRAPDPAAGRGSSGEAAAPGPRGSVAGPGGRRSIEKRTAIDYLEPAANGYPTKRLVEVGGSPVGFPFYERIEIGRQRSGGARPGLLLVADPTVSSRHCVVVQEPDGRCFVRDTSRNGTRLDGRRLSPNSKTPIAVGQVLTLGQGLELRLEGRTADRTAQDEITASQTLGIADVTMVTILVGDIRDFTVLVQRAPPEVLQASVARVFSRLEQEVVALGGTLKEFQGDALFAFWERGSTPDHAADACRAALALDRLARRLADDPDTWSVEGFPLAMDWALTTGPVSISGYGGDNILGLSMVGEAVVLAFRLEKLAGDDTGSLVVCPATRMLARRAFRFRDLGPRTAKGFDQPQGVWALLGER